MSDRKLLRLKAKFKATDAKRRKATDRAAAIEAKIDRLQALMRKAEDKEARREIASARAFERVMKARAKSLKGLIAKVKVRRRWNTDDEASEVTILKSLVADIEAMGGAS
jgi:chromosome segregation ATPase